jgi:hypothetical protein
MGVERIELVRDLRIRQIPPTRGTHTRVGSAPVTTQDSVGTFAWAAVG